MTENEMNVNAAWIDDGVDASRRGEEANIERIAGEVRDRTSAFPIAGTRV
jgi:glycine hydroxymethyltransferase